MARSAVALALGGCVGLGGPDGAAHQGDGDGPPEEGPPAGDGVADEADEDAAVESALAGCTASRIRTLNGAPYATYAYTYDEVGEPLVAEAVYADGSRSVATYSYSAPHRLDAMRVDASDDADDLYETYLWEDGHVVRVETDEGADGVVDVIEDRVYGDEDLVVHREWRIDGVLVQREDRTWTAAGDGFTGTGIGEHTAGSYTLELAADAARNLVHYLYEEPGYSHRQDYSGRNRLGYWERTEDETWELGYGLTTWVYLDGFDEQGRVVSEFDRYTYDLTVLHEELVYEAVRSYDCE